jgi:hypothetical protein
MGWALPETGELGAEQFWDGLLHYVDYYPNARLHLLRRAG